VDRRAKAALNKDKAIRLNESWGVGAVQVRYSDDGHWYAALARFPAALFDANGYVLFATDEEYRNSPHLKINKQISVRKPGISAIPGYVRIAASDAAPELDVDVHSLAATEGRRRLVLHLQRERNQSVVRKKKQQASSLDCEVCGFSFGRAYSSAAGDYCEVHHLLPLSDVDDTTKTRMEDLAILCANCHRVVHLHNPPYTLDQVRGLLVKP
jgi:predicted HNH restriction endonuclease